MQKSAKQRLINALKRSNWSRVKEDHPEGEVLRRGDIEILFLDTAWELYHYVSGELTFGVCYPYGRRQSQILQREVVKYEKWRRHEVSV